MKKAVLTIVSFLFLASPVNSAQGPDLNFEQIKLLKSIGKVAVPYYIPNGYWVGDVKVNNGKGPGGKSYSIQYICYCDGKGGEFLVSGANGGFGGPNGDYSFKVTNKNFGNVSVDVFLPGGEHGIELRHTKYISSELGKGPIYYFVIGGGERLDSLSPPPSKEELTKIIQSLNYLK